MNVQSTNKAELRVTEYAQLSLFFFTFCFSFEAALHTEVSMRQGGISRGVVYRSVAK